MTTKCFDFNIYAFFIALFVGLFYVYIAVPKPKIILKYPTPYNVEKITYRSESGDNCYKYKIEEVKCTDKSIPQPIV